MYTVDLFVVFLDPTLEPVSVKSEGGSVAEQAAAVTAEDAEDDISNIPYFELWLALNC